MKYYVLKYLTSYIKNSYKIIKSIKRVENSTILIEFEKNHKIYFDLNKGKSLIYKNDQPLVITKDFIAPFDKILIKTFSNCVIENVLLHNDDKIIRFYNKKSKILT